MDHTHLSLAAGFEVATARDPAAAVTVAAVGSAALDSNSTLFSFSRAQIVHTSADSALLIASARMLIYSRLPYSILICFVYITLLDSDLL